MDKITCIFFSLIFILFLSSSSQEEDEELDCLKMPVCKSEAPSADGKYYFDIETEKCEKLTKSECSGLNQFENDEECDESCRVPYFQKKNKRDKNTVIIKGKEVCELDREIGPCKALILVYYFNHESKKCETFHYGGCKGNGNNFNSMEECQSLCG